MCKKLYKNAYICTINVPSMKNRKLFFDILDHMDHKNAIVITGLRQVGKTTLLRQVYEVVGENKLWFDLDNPLDQMLFEDIDYHAIFRTLADRVHDRRQRIHVFLDEIQNLPRITKVMKFLIDHYGVKFFVTGSSGFYLKNLFPESLSGRKFLFQLPPMSFREILYFHDLISADDLRQHKLENALADTTIHAYKKYEKEYDQYLRFGGFPEVVTTEDPALKMLVLRNIFSSFFEKDLIFLSDYKDIRELRDLLLLLVPRVGSMLDVSRLASELGIDRRKVYHYLEFLQGIFLIRLLTKFSHSIDKSVAGGKKIYFADNGILNLIGRVNDGQLFENAVINQLSFYGPLSFYNYRNTAEIDAILDGAIAFEVKLTATQGDREKLAALAKKLGIPKLYLISRNFRQAHDVVYPFFL